MKYFHGILSIACLLAGCSQAANQNDSCFNGKIETLGNFREKIDLGKGERIEFDSINTGIFFTRDSMLFFFSWKYKKKDLHVFDMQGRWLGAMCRIGNAGNEFSQGCMPNMQEVNADGETKLWISDYGKKRHVLLNVTQSIIQKKDIIDSIMNFDVQTEATVYPFHFTLKLPEGKLLCRHPCYPLYENSKEYVLSKYVLYDKSLENPVREYNLYNKPVPNKTMSDGSIFSCEDAIKPDLTKIASTMAFMGQLNILDLETGVQTGYRLKGAPDFSYLGDPEVNFTVFYTGITTTDKYIFALYSGKPFRLADNAFKADIVHVFDWKGNPLYELTLENMPGAAYFDVDIDNGYLYCLDRLDSLYRYKLPPVLQ